MKGKITRIDIIALLVVMVISVIAGTILGGVLFGGHDVMASIGAQEIRQVFVDVNGDGKLDLLVEGSVIYNAPPLPEEQQQPQQ